MSLFDSKTFAFLTLDELDMMKDMPCMILLYCNQKHDKQERDLICDRFVASKCRWFTSVGVYSDLWETALDDADIRNNPGKTDCWAVTTSDKVLDNTTAQDFLHLIIDNPMIPEAILVIGDNNESLRVLIQEILASYKSYKFPDDWIWFSEIMSGLGFAMDCNYDFEGFKAHCRLRRNKTDNAEKHAEENLNILKQGERQSIGNHLLSQWKYYTHLDTEFDEYDMDYLHRLIDVLSEKL